MKLEHLNLSKNVTIETRDKQKQ